MNSAVDQRNAIMSQGEVHAFIWTRPDRYFAYVKELPPGETRHGFVRRALVTTWMGDVLGTAQLSAAFRGNFGDVRVPIRVRGINGCMYSGTYYKSAGDYCRLRRIADKPAIAQGQVRP